MKLIIAFFCSLIIPGIMSAQYQLQASLNGFKEGTVFYLKDIEADQILDSAVLHKGSLTIKGNLEDAPRSLWLYTSVNDHFYYCNLFIGNEKVRVEGSAKDMPYYMRITGSAIHAVDDMLNKKTASLSYTRDSLTNLVVPLMLKNEQQTRQDSIWSKIRKIDDSVKAITFNFINQHINSYAGLRQLYFLRFKLDSSALRQLYMQIRPPFTESRFTKTIHTFLQVGAPLKTGDHFRDFTAIDSSGKSHQLSDYLGKYILLNFSTTYCGPCIMSKEELKEVAIKYSEQLSLVGFNADASRDTWLKGIRRDQPTWPVIWDGKSGHSETIQKYGVQGYPSFVLLDPNGIILHRWSGYSFNDRSILKLLQKMLPPPNMQ